MDTKTSIGIITLLFALFFVYKAMERQREIGACNGCKVEATVIDNRIQMLSQGICTYYPVYEYEVDGEIKTFQSAYPVITPMKMGSQVKLYYNHGRRVVVEQASYAAETALAIVFGGAAALLLNA